MGKEIDSIIATIESVMDGQPWFGRPLFSLVEEIHPAVVFKRPNEDGHSLIDLVYHMITWTEFALGALEGRDEKEMKRIEELDWRQIDPKEHTWSTGLEILRSLHVNIIAKLKTLDDDILDNIVPGRKYSYRFMLNGLIQHDIYHAGQVAFLKKLFSPERE